MGIENQVIKLTPEEDFKITTDQDSSLGYEQKRLLYLFSLPLMWILTIWVMCKKKILGIKPRINTFWFDGLSVPCRQIKEGSGSWLALEIIYNFQFNQKHGIRGKVSDYWIGMINAQAVRNRLRLVKRELIEAITEVSKNENEVRLWSLASGSAQAVIEVMAEKKEINIKTTLLDLDPTAISKSRKLAEEKKVADRINFVVGNTRQLEKIANGSPPHIIEMVGFLDYRPDVRAVHLIKRIYKLLLSEGIFLTANICPNPEQWFLKWVIDWSMIYRKAETLGDIVVKGGFSPEHCQIIYEPLKLHAVAVCRKLV